jgi:hypothetical protein
MQIKFNRIGSKGQRVVNFLAKFKNYDEDDIISKILFLYFSFIHGAIGIFLVFNDLSEYKSKVFDAMSYYVPMSFWGIMFLISSFSFIIVAIQEGRPKYIFMTMAGLFGSITFGLLAMASLELSPQQTNTVNYAIISSIDLIIFIVGGAALWIRRG